MKRLLIFFFILSNIYNSYSCSCGYKKITQKEYDRYSLIFTGEIVEVEDCDNEGYQEFTFEIEQIYKGQTTKFISGFNNCGGVCNYSYKLGQKWLVYSNPEYGLINDQYACIHSILIALEGNEILIGKDYNISKEDWNFEIDFIQKRKTKDTKIINFQFVKIIPALKTSLILGLIILFFLLSYKFKLKLLPYSIGLGIIGGILLYFLIKLDLFPKLKGHRMMYVFVVWSFLLISNFISAKNKFSIIKSFISNYITYISIIITLIYMIILNEYQKIEFDTEPYIYIKEILGIGILFSFLIALIFECYIRVKKKSGI